MVWNSVKLSPPLRLEVWQRGGGHSAHTQVINTFSCMFFYFSFFRVYYYFSMWCANQTKRVCLREFLGSCVRVSWFLCHLIYSFFHFTRSFRCNAEVGYKKGGRGVSSELLIHFLMFRKKNVHLYFFTVPFVVHREGDERSAWPGWVDILYWWVILSETFILFLVLVFLRKTVLLPCRPTICCLMSSRFVLREIYRQQSYSSFYYCEMLKKKDSVDIIICFTVNSEYVLRNCSLS